MAESGAEDGGRMRSGEGVDSGGGKRGIKGGRAALPRSGEHGHQRSGEGQWRSGAWRSGAWRSGRWRRPTRQEPSRTHKDGAGGNATRPAPRRPERRSIRPFRGGANEHGAEERGAGRGALAVAARGMWAGWRMAGRSEPAPCGAVPCGAVPCGAAPLGAPLMAMLGAKGMCCPSSAPFSPVAFHPLGAELMAMLGAKGMCCPAPAPFSPVAFHPLGAEHAPPIRSPVRSLRPLGCGGWRVVVAFPRTRNPHPAQGGFTWDTARKKGVPQNDTPFLMMGGGFNDYVVCRFTSVGTSSFICSMVVPYVFKKYPSRCPTRTHSFAVCVQICSILGLVYTSILDL